MWAPITMEFPPTLWRQGPRSRRTGPKNRNRAQKQLIWLSKKIPLGPAQIHAGPKKISPQGPENTGTSSTFFVPPGPKKIRPDPKNMYRSKKRCPGPKNMQPIKISCFCCVHVHFFSLTLCIRVAQCFFQHVLGGPVIFWNHHLLLEKLTVLLSGKIVRFQ